MAVVMSDNFDGVPGGSFLGDAHYTANISLSLVAGHYGVAVRFPADTIAWLGQTAFAGTTGPRVFSRIYKLSNAPSATAQIFQVRSSGGAMCTATFRTTGTLALHNTGSTGTILAQTSSAVPYGSEFRVVYTVNGTSFTATVYPDVSSTTPTQTIGPVTITGGTMVTTREGNPNAGGTQGATLDLSWPVDDDASDPGLRRYARIDPELDDSDPPQPITSGFGGRLFKAAVHSEGFSAGTKTYTMDWGDGVVTGPQSSDEFSHIYGIAGEFTATAYVEVS